MIDSILAISETNFTISIVGGIFAAVLAVVLLVVLIKKSKKDD